MGKNKFSRNFWTVIGMEFGERGSYYGVMSILSIYLSMAIADGGLGFSKEQVGLVLSIVTPIIYLVPIISGALADRYGYKKTLYIAFFLLSLGYFLTSLATSYYLVFGALLVMALGAGMFKPVVSGTIARETTPENSSVGFGIFYWSVNLGACLFPLILVPILKDISWSYIFVMASVVTGLLIFVNYFLFKEPQRPENKKKLSEVMSTMFVVLKDYRFIALIFIYSGFWVLYFQMFGTVLWYLQDHVDTLPIDNAVNNFLSMFIENPSWKFDIEHVTVLNALTIITLQLFVSNIVKRFEALPTMITGIIIGTIGMAILALSSSVWIFIIGMVVFSIGEMTAHPKYSSYIGLIAPEDKKALYLGYSFLCSVIGSAIAGVLGSSLYVHYIDNLNQPKTMWLIFACIGIVSATGLYLYNKLVIKKA
ncbi:MAG: MFS transporter [Rikenellaceae bacterium]